MKEYLDNGGSIRALNTKKSINFKALSRHVDKLKASIIDDSKYIDYFLNSEGQIESRIKKNTRNKYNKIDLTIELINAAEAYRKENTFITLSLAGLYQEHLRRELDNGVWGDIKDLAKYLKEYFLTSVEYKKFIKELRNGAACKYMNEFLMDHDISELNSKDFEKKMLEEAKALSMKRTSPEEYIPDLVETFRKLRTEQQEIEKLANMTPEEEREFMGKDWQAWGIPLGAAAMGIIFGATASFTLIDDFNAALGATNIQFIISSVVGSVAALVRSINLSEKRKMLDYYERLYNLRNDIQPEINEGARQESETLQANIKEEMRQENETPQARINEEKPAGNGEPAGVRRRRRQIYENGRPQTVIDEEKPADNGNPTGVSRRRRQVPKIHDDDGQEP